MAGRAQKPVSQLQNRREGRADRRTFPIAVPRDALVAPPPPKGLKTSGKAVWAAYWSDPVCLAATGVDGFDIARYCVLHDRRDEQERLLAGEGATVEGYAGDVINPRFRIVKELTREIEKYREQLGVLPLARMRLGLVQTQRDIGVADLRRRLERAGEATDAIEAEATEVVDLDEMG